MKKYLVILSILLSIITSCSENDKNDCVENKIAYVTSVNSPSNGLINEIVNLKIDFGVSNGCGEFGEFVETQNENLRMIEVIARYEGCVCTQDSPIRTVNYEFETRNSGNYELRFKSSEKDFIIINLLIK